MPRHVHAAAVVEAHSCRAGPGNRRVIVEVVIRLEARHYLTLSFVSPLAVGWGRLLLAGGENLRRVSCWCLGAEDDGVGSVGFGPAADGYVAGEFRVRAAGLQPGEQVAGGGHPV